MDSNIVIQTELCEVNQNYYQMCRPSLFPLRFIGGPPGLWRLKSAGIKSRKYRKICSIIMLVAMNLGAVSDAYHFVRASNSTILTFSQNMNLFFALAISVSG